MDRGFSSSAELVEVVSVGEKRPNGEGRFVVSEDVRGDGGDLVSGSSGESGRDMFGIGEGCKSS